MILSLLSQADPFTAVPTAGVLLFLIYKEMRTRRNSNGNGASMAALTKDDLRNLREMASRSKDMHDVITEKGSDKLPMVWAERGVTKAVQESQKAICEEFGKLREAIEENGEKGRLRRARGGS